MQKQPTYAEPVRRIRIPFYIDKAFFAHAATALSDLDASAP